MNEENGEFTPRHLLVYVKTNIVGVWRSWTEGANYRADPPFLYGSDSRTFDVNARTGSVLWIIGRLPRLDDPTLVAKITVGGRIDLGDAPTFDYTEDSARFAETVPAYNYKYLAFGDPGNDASRFFPFNCATEEILALVFGKSREHLWTIAGDSEPADEARWETSFGSKILSPAIVAEKHEGDEIPGPDPLIRLEERSRDSAFLSWKWEDLKERHRPLLEEFVHALTREKVFCWFDLFSLPGYDEEEERGDLRRLLMRGSEQSRLLVAVASENYEKGWTREEWDGLGTSRLPRMVWNPLGMDLRGTIFEGENCIDSSDPHGAAVLLKNCLDEI